MQGICSVQNKALLCQRDSRIEFPLYTEHLSLLPTVGRGFAVASAVATLPLERCENFYLMKSPTSHYLNSFRQRYFWILTLVDV